MTDTTENGTDENQTGSETPPEGEEQQPNDEAKPNEGEADENGDENKPEEKPEEGDDEDSKLDLDGAKKALSKVRQEAAKNRTKLRDLEAKLKDAKTPEQVAEIVSGLTESNAKETRALLVENVALKAGLPDEALDRLKGETREELEADAKALAKLLGTKTKVDPDVDGGLSPSGGEPEVFDAKAAREAARKVRSRRA